MEPKFQSSFIPKGPIGTPATFSSTNQSKGGLVGFIAIILFVLAVAASLGVFAYNFYLTSSIAKMGTNLEAARATLEPESIKEITRLNSRIVSTQELVSNHTVLSPLFDFLESSTVRTVRFNEFTYSSGEKGLTLAMKGQARGYTAVALQADIFSKSQYIKNPVFSDLSLDTNGNVIFSFKATLDPSIISYKKQLEGLNGSSVPVQTSVSTSTPVVEPTTNPVVSPATSTSATSTKKKI